MDKMKPCPFCGGAASIFQIPENTTAEMKSHPKWLWNFPGAWVIGCDTDRCYGNIRHFAMQFTSAAQAVRTWNQRRESKELLEMLNLRKRVEAQREEIKRLQAVDAVPVVHGHWVTEEEAIEKDDYLLRDTCSVCGHCDWDCTESQDFKYCPNCGAKMDGREGGDA